MNFYFIRSKPVTCFSALDFIRLLFLIKVHCRPKDSPAEICSPSHFCHKSLVAYKNETPYGNCLPCPRGMHIRATCSRLKTMHWLRFSPHSVHQISNLNYLPMNRILYTQSMNTLNIQQLSDCLSQFYEFSHSFSMSAQGTPEIPCSQFTY